MYLDVLGIFDVLKFRVAEWLQGESVIKCGSFSLDILLVRERLLDFIETYSSSWKISVGFPAFRLNCPPLFAAEDRLEVQAPQGFRVPRDCQAQVPCQDIVAM